MKVASCGGFHSSGEGGREMLDFVFISFHILKLSPLRLAPLTMFCGSSCYDIIRLSDDIVLL